MQISMPISWWEVDDILQGFAKLPSTVQKKYIGKAVAEVAKPHIQKVRGFTPRGPTGNLRRSVGMKVERKKRNTTAMSVLGYRRKNGGSSREKGFHAYWIENGVGDRWPKGAVLAINSEYSRQYDYLNTALFDLYPTGGPYENVLFHQVRGFSGNGNFERWAAATLPSLKKQLQKTLAANLSKAIDAHRAKQRAKATK